MADGGELIARWANRLVGNNPKAQEQRGRSEERDAPPPPPPKMMHGGELPNVMFATGGEIPKAPPPPKPSTPIPEWMRYALRDGGVVPGKGEGDKIPALYEPGEFVVSNDMIERNPGLREHLHSLRDETLEAQGKDPEEVDRKQAQGKTLRAAFGADGSWDGKFAPEFEAKGVKPPGAAAGGPGGFKMPTDFPKPVAAAAEAVTKNGWRAGLRASLADPLAGKALGRMALTAAGPVAGAAGVGAAIGTVGYHSLPEDMQTSIGRGVNAGLRKIGLGFDDSALRQMDGVDPTPSGPVNPTKMGTAMTPGDAAPTAPGDNSAVYAAANADLGSYMQKNLRNGASEEGVVRREGNSFSGTNVSGYGNQMTVPGMDPAALDKALTNPNGTRWSARDNAIMAANMAAGNNPYMGTSAAQEGPLSPIEKALRDNPVGTVGRQSALKAAAEMENTQTLRRGQDVQLAGIQSSSRTARMQAQIEQMNKDRQFGLDVAKFGEEKAKTNFEARQKAQKDLTDEIASYLPPGADNKPDTANAAGYMGAMQAHVSERMEGLRKHLQLNPGDKGAAAELEGLESRGVAQMGPEAKRKFLAAMGVQGVVKDTATGGFNPFGTKMVDSDAPITSLTRKERLFGADYVSNRGDEIPARHIDRSGSTLGIGGVSSTRYQPLIVDEKKKLRE